MMPRDPLCELPPPPPAGCCDPPPRLPAAPLTPDNPPGLTAIRYRIGTFSNFRRAMLDDVARPDLLGPGTPNPFVTWREGADGDYHTMLIELWAYLADILTFYQERIANEAYLPTATQRDSLRRLAALIGYRPAPGAAAAALLAFTVERGKTLTLPVRFRAGGRAAPGRPAAVFETGEAAAARGEHSAVPLSAVAPTNQFAPLSAFTAFTSGGAPTAGEMAAALTQLYGSAGSVYLAAFLASTVTVTLTQPAFTLLGTSASTGTGGTVVSASATRAAAGAAAPSIPIARRAVTLKGVNARLAVGDHVLVVENEGGAGETSQVRQLTEVSLDREAGTTTIGWSETSLAGYTNVTLYALRVTAAPFGSNAPAWNTLPATLNGTVNGVNGPYFNRNWDDPADRWSRLPTPGDAPGVVGDPPGVLFLDAIYDDAQGTEERPGWAVLLAGVATGLADPRQVFHVIDARPASKAAYGVSGRVTRLTLRESIPGTGSATATDATFPLRSTVALTGAERLELQNMLPLPEPLAGNTLILAGLFPDLREGQAVIVRGRMYDPATVPPSRTPAAEPAVIGGPPALDVANALTTVTLRRPLANRYARDGAELLANVVEATHGETVRDEVLGSGDGSALQRYPLKQKPLTYLPATDPEGLSAVESTLTVTVNGVQWTERTTLLESASNAQEFTTSQDDAGATSVVFGDGANGARPPTGRDNIRARYRKGLGTGGNLAANAIIQMIDSLPGLQKVTNPLPSLGGTDPEDAAGIRCNAPAGLRTFGRAVSADDYAALALTFPGVAKASASYVRRDPVTLRALPQPYIQLTVATVGNVPLAQQPGLATRLRAFLDRRRDPNVSLRIGEVVPVHIDVAATIDVHDAFPRQATLAAVRAALNPGLNPDGSAGYFAFERLGFGESIHLSAVYEALHAVAGVRSALITTLRRPDLDSDVTTVRDTIFIGPGEIAVIGDDPADEPNLLGKLGITLGEGGFDDS